MRAKGSHTSTKTSVQRGRGYLAVLMVLKRAGAIILAACVLALMTPAVFAQTGVTVVGSLTITTPLAANFPNVTLTGAVQTLTAGLDGFTVDDSRGTGEGWHVTAQATRFSEVDILGAYVSGGKQLPPSSLTMSEPTVTANSTTSPSPSITPGPYTVDEGSGVKIASAAVDTGMGMYDFSATTLTLTVPSSAYSRTYKSDVTITVASAP